MSWLNYDFLFVGKNDQKVKEEGSKEHVGVINAWSIIDVPRKALRGLKEKVKNIMDVVFLS